jgi:hypothetical protein
MGLHSEGRTEIDRAVIRYLRRLAVEILADAKERCPKKTGHLAESLTAEVNEDEKTVYIMTDVPYALDVELGTRPHRIYSKTYPDGRLVFFWAKFDQWVAFPYVNHPGTPAQPFMAPALHKHRGAL